MASSIATIDGGSFDKQVLKAGLPTLVLFTAAWSAPAKKMEATLQGVAPSYEGRLGVFKVDFDSSPDIIQQYEVQSVPELRFFKSAQVIGKKMGVLEKEALKTWIDALLK